MFLKFKPYRQLSIRSDKWWKLSPKYAGPFKVTQRVGDLAYKLELPEGAKIHNVFHVSVLKRHLGPSDAATPSLPAFENHIQDQTVGPDRVLARRIVKKGNRAQIQWCNSTEEKATWEDWEAVTQHFPQFIA